MVTEAKNRGNKAVIIPYENWKEAESVTGIEVFGMHTLRDTVQFLEGRLKPSPKEGEISITPERNLVLESIDFADVKGQRELIEAIVLGTAGSHNILMIGEPGCGKTMIAERIPTILPQMTEKEALEVTKIHSISGLL